MVVGQNYITDMIESPVRYANNTTGTVKWYQFKVPVRSPDQVIGTVDVQNIRFIRMFAERLPDTGCRPLRPSGTPPRRMAPHLFAAQHRRIRAYTGSSRRHQV